MSKPRKGFCLAGELEEERSVAPPIRVVTVPRSVPADGIMIFRKKTPLGTSLCALSNRA